MIRIIFRTTEQKNKNKKNKPDWITPLNCLKNLYTNALESEIFLFGDRLEPETLKSFEGYYNWYDEIKNHGNSESFLEVMEWALNSFNNDDILYFVEDDYIHRKNYEVILREGLERSDYVSLYDHPDKYTGKPEILFHTKSTHWKFTHSTTMTFACKYRTLMEDVDTFRKLITTGTPPDHFLFLELGKWGRRLATPIPGYSTHGEIEFLAPVIKWDNE